MSYWSGTLALCFYNGNDLFALWFMMANTPAVTSFLSDSLYSAATRQGDIATSSPNAKSTSPSSTQIPSAQASDSRQDTGATGTNHGVDDSNEPIVDDSESPRVQIRVNAMENGEENVSWIRELCNTVDGTIQFAGPVMIALTDFFTSIVGVRLERIEHGSVKFVVHVESREGLNKLWSMYTTGELAKKLTEIVITYELTTEDKSDLDIQATIQESNYEQASRFFDELEEDQ